MQVDTESRIHAIDRRLPQTQCESCGHRGCLAYARAVTEGRAEINQCPPGGQPTIDAVANLLGRDSMPPDAARTSPPLAQTARVREADCIGCKLCIAACPVDCILGAEKMMHAVIEKECSGCELCLPACPADCIEMIPRARDAHGAPSIWPELSQTQVAKWRTRAAQKRAREQRAAKQKPTPRRRALQREILQAVRRKQNENPACPAA